MKKPTLVVDASNPLVSCKSSEVIEVKIADLCPHPRQVELFPRQNAALIEALAADIEQRGQQDPIHITPDNIIITGHNRVAAMKRLDAKRIKAVVRTDLLTEQAINEHHAKDNFHRKQLSLLERARIAQFLVESQVAKDSPRCEARQEVGKLLKMSDREVSRLLAVLKAPLEVQLACDAGKISLVTAGKIGALPAKQQAAAAKKIAAGERPDFSSTKSTRKGSKPNADALSKQLRAFEAQATKMAGLLGKVDRELLSGAEIGKAVAALTCTLDGLCERLSVGNVSARKGNTPAVGIPPQHAPGCKPFRA